MIIHLVPKPRLGNELKAKPLLSELKKKQKLLKQCVPKQSLGRRIKISLATFSQEELLVIL